MSRLRNLTPDSFSLSTGITRIALATRCAKPHHHLNLAHRPISYTSAHGAIGRLTKYEELMLEEYGPNWKDQLDPAARKIQEDREARRLAWEQRLRDRFGDGAEVYAENQRMKQVESRLRKQAATSVHRERQSKEQLPPPARRLSRWNTTPAERQRLHKEWVEAARVRKEEAKKERARRLKESLERVVADRAQKMEKLTARIRANITRADTKANWLVLLKGKFGDAWWEVPVDQQVATVREPWELQPTREAQDEAVKELENHPAKDVQEKAIRELQEALVQPLQESFLERVEARRKLKKEKGKIARELKKALESPVARDYQARGGQLLSRGVESFQTSEISRTSRILFDGKQLLFTGNSLVNKAKQLLPRDMMVETQ